MGCKFIAFHDIVVLIWGYQICYNDKGINMNNILIIEDNPVFADTVEQALLELPQVCKIYKATSVKQGLDMIKERSYSLFIVDIGLPDGSGYDFITEIRNDKQYENSFVIILTGLQESAVEIIDSFNNKLCNLYFQKPLIMKDFKDKVSKLIETGSIKSEPNRLKIKLKQSTVFFEYQDIVYIETNNKQTTVHCIQGSYAIGRYSLSSLAKELECDRFKRIHRSYIVNLYYVREIIRSTNDCIVYFEDRLEKIPIGSNYRDVLEQV